jgi:AbrB family looped-hinge helix DNA binding protein
MGIEAGRCRAVPVITLDITGKNSYIISMKTVVSEKGQITIPKAVRDELGINAGTVLEVESVEGKLVAVKKESVDAILKWRGRSKIPGSKTVDEYLRRIRG